jgi:hypothetical protein
VPAAYRVGGPWAEVRWFVAEGVGVAWRLIASLFHRLAPIIGTAVDRPHRAVVVLAIEALRAASDLRTASLAVICAATAPLGVMLVPHQA